MRARIVLMLLCAIITASSYAQCPPEIEQAIVDDDLELLQRFLDKGGDINCRDKSEWKQPLLHKAIYSGHEETSIFLINHGADIHAQDAWGMSALYKTGFYGSVPIATLLIEKGATVDTEHGEKKMTPLMLAANNNHLELVKFLIAKGANVNHQCKDGQTPMNYTSNPEIVAYLLENGANKDLKNYQGFNALQQATRGLILAKHSEDILHIRTYEKIIELLDN